MLRAYNKLTKTWTSTVNGSDLPGDINNWIVDPVFQDEEFAMQIGQQFWTFNGNTINTPTFQSYQEMILQKDKLDLWDLIRDERDRRKLDGGYKVGNHWFHSDTSSRIQQIGLVMMGANLPSSLLWKTMSGEFVTMTPQLAGQIFQTAAYSDTVIFTVAEQKRQEMLTYSEPRNYNYKTGWPLVYGE